MKQFSLFFLLACVPLLSAEWVSSSPSPYAFPLVVKGRAATLVTSPRDATVVDLAVSHLRADLTRVTGVPSVILNTTDDLPAEAPVVLIGTLGLHPLIDVGHCRQ